MQERTNTIAGTSAQSESLARSVTYQPPSNRAVAWSWKLYTLTALAGLGTCYLVNRLSPPASLPRALGRYALSLAPAVLYQSLSSLYDLTIIRGTPFSATSSQERARQAELGIPDTASMYRAYTSAWLQHPGSLDFSDQDILREHQRSLRVPHALVALAEAALQTDWQLYALPGGEEINSEHFLEGSALPSDGTDFNIRFKYRDIDQSLCLPLLQPEQAMIILLSTHPDPDCSSGYAMAVYRAPDGRYFLFDSTQEQVETRTVSGCTDAIRHTLGVRKDWSVKALIWMGRRPPENAENAGNAQPPQSPQT
ncbi:MAG: hypothetical protein OXC07_13315 [Kistimonas sp.]|nr:hypothetical protein [Kistimonas sp.]